METYVIYSDDRQKIEILKPLHDLLEDQRVKWLELNPVAKDYLYGMVLKTIDLKQRGWDTQERLTAGSVPIVEPGRPLALSSPFDIFNQALSIISYEMTRLQFNQEEVKLQIQELVQDQEYQLICEFFDLRLFKVDGFLAYYKNNTLLILLFSLKEDF